MLKVALKISVDNFRETVPGSAAVDWYLVRLITVLYFHIVRTKSKFSSKSALHVLDAAALRFDHRVRDER